jgi:hypothetical protein
LAVVVVVVDVVVTGARFVDVVGLIVVTGVETVSGRCLATEGVEPVSVKTSTSNSSGLDHIRRWALLKEKRRLTIILAG